MKMVFMILQVIASLILIISILLQSGKTAGLSGSIAGGAEQLLGKSKGRGYDAMLARVTKIGAGAFIICSLVLVYLQK